MRSVFISLIIASMILSANPAAAAYWGLAGCSGDDTAAIFHYDWQTSQFEVGPSIALGPFGENPSDAVHRPYPGDEVWITGADGNGVVVIDPTGAVIHEIPTGAYPVSVAFSHLDGIALVSCRDSDRLDIVDLATYTVVDSLAIPGGRPGNIVYDPRGKRFFVAEWNGDMLFRIAPDGSSITGQASVGTNLWQLAIDPNFRQRPLYVTDLGTDQVRFIDPESLTQIDAVVVGDDPRGIDVDGELVVVCCESSNDVFLIDGFNNGAVTRLELPVDADPRDVSIATGFVSTKGQKVLLGGAAYVGGGLTSAGSPVYVIEMWSFELVDAIVLPGIDAKVVTVESQWPIPSSVEDLPGASVLKPTATPNPFNPSTTISFTLNEQAEVALGVFDLAGRLVRRMDVGTKGAGSQSIAWDGTDGNGRRCSAGTYLLLLEAGDLQAGTKVVLLP